MPTPGKANRGPSAGPENRRALVTAAREVFAEDGLSAPLSSVAKRAGVGQGSLYRHFPDRIALAAAVFDENIGDLEVVVDRQDSTLDDFLDLVIAQAVVSTALIELLTSHRRDERIAHLGDRLASLVTTITEREKAAGRIGQHVAVEDVTLAISMLAGELARTEPDARASVGRRAWALFHAAFAP